MPMETRTTLGAAPARICASSSSWRWVVEAGEIGLSAAVTVTFEIVQ